MFGKKESDEDLKAFEARLAALRPRAGLPSPFGGGAGGEGLAGDALELEIPPSPPALTLALSQREGGRCDDPAGHRFVCVHCGSEATVAAGRRWPAALAAMTCAAAVLFVMLVTQRTPSGAPTGSPGGSDDLAGRATGGAMPSGLEGPESGPPPGARGDAMPYVCLREQVLRHGVEWLDRSLPTPFVPVTATEKPLTNRELLDRLIEEESLRGS